MSKVSAMQAMREARYTNRPATKAAAPAVAVEPTWSPVETSEVTLWPVAPEPAEAMEQDPLCGHRSMNNRSCRRPAGHSEKNHRYS